MPDEHTPSFKKYFVIAVALPFIAAAMFAYEIALPHSPIRETREVAITKGMGSRAIGALLKEQSVIRSKWTFVVYVSLRGAASSLKPGVYAFSPLSILDITRDLVAGGKNEREITVPEGWTARDIGQYLEREAVSTTEVFAVTVSAESAMVFAERFSFLTEKPASAGLEGYLFPDTYRLSETATARDAVIKMLENFARRVDRTMRQEITRQEKTLFQVVTMASLIEKEVVSDEDRAVVSGLLWKRLDAGIPLQVDATIAYAQMQNAKRKVQSNGKISIADTKIDSLYNTYLYRGLPPGPIANPGLSAIRAAIYPKSSPYLYYLSSPDGRTIFSKTLDEHNAAKAEYLR